MYVKKFPLLNGKLFNFTVISFSLKIEIGRGKCSFD